MASGQVSIIRTDADGQQFAFGVPGENDVSVAFFQTKPIALAEGQADAFVEAIISEFTGDHDGVTLSYVPLNRMVEGETLVFQSIGAPDGDRPLFLDEDQQKTMRYIIIRYDDIRLNNWALSGIEFWGEYEGDEDAVI